MNKTTRRLKANYTVNVSCESIALPPFEDILVLAHRCPQGKLGVSKCISLMSPDDFEMIPIDHEMVEAIIVNNKILKKMPASQIIETLKETVFPLVSHGEIIKVDFKISISWSNLETKND